VEAGAASYNFDSRKLLFCTRLQTLQVFPGYRAPAAVSQPEDE
jgi:hypothetical protein